MSKSEKITPLYERLSRDDEYTGREQFHIQPKTDSWRILPAGMGCQYPTHFTDDGISGTRFDRPGFLGDDGGSGGRACRGNLCIKDMSRLGRDYLKVGQVMEVLRQRGVRLIAINDGVDSLKGDDDFTPFRSALRHRRAAGADELR